MIKENFPASKPEKGLKSTTTEIAQPLTDQEDDNPKPATADARDLNLLLFAVLGPPGLLLGRRRHTAPEVQTAIPTTSEQHPPSPDQ